jgi:hypothetical protein
MPRERSSDHRLPWPALAIGLLSCLGCSARGLPGPDDPGVVAPLDLSTAGPRADLGTAGADLAPPGDLGLGPSSTPARVWACPRDSFVTVSWTPVAGAVGYRVYTSTTTPVPLTPANGIAAASPGIEVPATNNVALYVVVAAELPAGEAPPSAEVHATPFALFTLPHDQLWTSSGVTYEGALEEWEDFSSLANGAMNTRVVNGAETGLVAPDVGSVAIDPLRGTVYVSDSRSGHLGIWDYAAGYINGDVTPTRTLVANKLPLANPSYASSPSGVALDGKRQILYVAEENEINVFLDACHADGVSPDGEAAGIDTGIFSGVTHQLQIDEAHDDLYVAIDSAILVFHPASAMAAGGDIAPARVIHVPSNLSLISAVWLDSSSDELYIGDQGAHGIYVLAGASAADGLVQPSIFMSAPTSATPIYPSALAGGGGYLFDAQGSVRVWRLDSIHAGVFSDFEDLTKTVPGSLGGITYLP